MRNVCSRFSLVLVALFSPILLSAQHNAANAPVVLQGSTDIGKTQKGATVPDPAEGTYRVTGGGADMWGTADDFRLSWVRLAGDATLSADVNFPTPPADHLAKGVLIFRQSLDPASAYADVAIHGDGHITLQYRASAGAKTEDVTSPEHGSTRLRIERKGKTFTAYTGSADDTMKPFASTDVALNGPVYVGLGVCSHNADGLVTVVFSNLAIEQPSRAAAASARK